MTCQGCFSVLQLAACRAEPRPLCGKQHIAQTPGLVVKQPPLARLGVVGRGLVSWHWELSCWMAPCSPWGVKLGAALACRPVHLVLYQQRLPTVTGDSALFNVTPISLVPQPPFTLATEGSCAWFAQ